MRPKHDASLRLFIILAKAAIAGALFRKTMDIGAQCISAIKAGKIAACGKKFSPILQVLDCRQSSSNKFECLL